MTTAPKESHNPPDKGASGSTASTTASAMIRVSKPNGRRWKNNATATTANMHTARWVGMVMPASSAYTRPASKPATTPAFGAGSSSGSVPANRQHPPTSSSTSPDTNPMCRPEMATRWMVPVRISTSQSRSFMSWRRPTTSAVTSPARAPAGSASRMKSATRPRKPAMEYAPWVASSNGAGRSRT